ncbi:RepA protein [Granulicella rosea]|uniref:RepA protein n=1 Tax=Granulicella rosea TaxID=474952 RepID=A0A239ML35_9BACT|nr:replication protein RepA [Granulicella rosea]SNT42832.1 RepA protein [Granulicella rosea]
MTKDVGEVQKPVKRTKSGLSPKQERIIQTALDLDNDPSGQADVSYMHSVLTQVSLPRRKVLGDSFERKSGNASVLLQAGKLWNGHTFDEQPLPYGPMPRLIIAWMSTFAIRNKTREIPVGNSATEFLEILGYTVGGGKRGTFTTFRQQTRSLAAVRMTLGLGTSTFNGGMIQQFDAWQSEGKNMALWPGRLVLSENFYDSLIKRAVPLNNQVLRALRGSSLALDIYTWLAQRLHRVHSTAGDEISWTRLKEQFGHEYSDDAQGRKNFRKEFESALHDVLRLYPKARIETNVKNGENVGKILRLSPPPVSK